MATIQFEAIKNKNLITDVDKCRQKYFETVDDVKVKFISPSFKLYDQFYYYLIKNSSYISLDKKYYYRPDYLSFDTYGTETLWPLLLYLNDKSSIEDFHNMYCYIPYYSSILKMIEYINVKDVINLDNIVYKPSSTFNFSLYSSKTKIPSSTSNDEVTREEETPLPSFIRQKFILNDTNIFNKYVDLAYTPIVETVNLKIVGQNIVLTYDEHYTIVEDSYGNLRRLIWTDTDNFMGGGLESILTINMILNVEYAREE